jgi:hypothetical protein
MINFPTGSIAESVVSRIMGVARRNPPSAELSGGRPAGNVQAQSEALDAQLAQPVPEMPALDPNPSSQSANAVEATLSGGRPMQGLLDTLSGM